MLRLPPDVPPRWARWARWIACLGLVSALVPSQPRPIAADEIILVPDPFVRKFPADFCPFPVELDFTATGSTATIFVTANVYVFDGSQFQYAHQAIDNIAVVRDSVYALHLLTNDETSYYFSCYSGGPTVPFIFEFDQINPGDAPYLELFESAAAGWDLAHGAYYETPRSGPNNPSSSSPTSGIGCLGLGATSGSPSLADSAKTSVKIGGLIGAKRYVLTGWWIADAEGIPTGNVSLTIQVTGPDQTPLARKTWGGLKSRYR